MDGRDAVQTCCAMKMDLLHGSTVLEEVRCGYLVIHRQSHVDKNRLSEEVELGHSNKGRLAAKFLSSGTYDVCSDLGPSGVRTADSKRLPPAILVLVLPRSPCHPCWSVHALIPRHINNPQPCHSGVRLSGFWQKTVSKSIDEGSIKSIG